VIHLITALHVLACLFLILVVLLQSGKGGGMGIAFGGGGSQTVFGSSGAGNFLTRATAVTAGIFMLTSVSLAYFASQQESRHLRQISAKRKQEEKAKREREELLKKQIQEQGAPGAPAPPALPGTTPSGPIEESAPAQSTAPETPAPAPSPASESAAPPAPAKKSSKK